MKKPVIQGLSATSTNETDVAVTLNNILCLPVSEIGRQAREKDMCWIL